MKSLNEIYRILKHGGLFVFSSHNRNTVKDQTKVRFSLSMNPIKFARNLLRSFIYYIRHMRMRKYEVDAQDYEIANDRGLNYGLLLYYISKMSQIRQLNQIGFEIIDIVDLRGNSILAKDAESHSQWLYYVARKE